MKKKGKEKEGRSFIPLWLRTEKQHKKEQLPHMGRYIWAQWTHERYDRDSKTYNKKTFNSKTHTDWAVQGLYYVQVGVSK